MYHHYYWRNNVEQKYKKHTLEIQIKLETDHKSISIILECCRAMQFRLLPLDAIIEKLS